MSARVLVTGAGGPAGRSLVTQLLERGHDVVATDMTPTSTPTDVPFELVPAAGEPDFVDRLRDLALGHGVDLVVPTVTEELGILAGSGGVGFPVLVSVAEPIRIAGDKWLTYRRLAAAGVAVPHSVLPIGAAMNDEAVCRRLGDRCLSKPRSGRGGRGVLIHTVPPDRSLIGADDIVQGFVPGTEYAPNLYVAADPADDVVVVLEKTSLAHGEHGNATVVRVATDPTADAVGVLALRAARVVVSAAW